MLLERTKISLDDLIELGLSTRDDQKVPSLLVQVSGEGLANTISSTSDD